ncbi:tetratricopeptide repeat protein [Tardiphaga sp. 42S5]|uniref:tetratricopeptide repeat protein n=1 Tax=Tardiphaga sp. 42S5 TaxID=1404799 RepID=UPI002A598F23|nr:tetratricopeptide repeat protein [Tardiphaga sp. 42S5]WPO43229.1 tetratricopeptide repeat protein [Tardiphaga sp. 42S5]
MRDVAFSTLGSSSINRGFNAVASASLPYRLRRFARVAFGSLLGARPVRHPATEIRFARPLIAIRRRYADAAELKRFFSENPTEALRAIRAAADDGIPAAQTVWGQILLDGKLVPRDPVAAFHAFAMAADGGDIEALNMVGRCHEQGWGVAVNAGRATEVFEAAAKAGHLWAQVNLAQMLMRTGAPEDRPRCFALFKAAAEGGNSKANIKAMNSLARFLEEGWAGSPNLDGAAFWYLKAANAGDHWAQFNLATILLRQGDRDAADKWFHSAIAISDNGFRRRVAALLLARPEPELRIHGIEALRRCAEVGAPEDLFAHACALDDGLAGPRDLNQAAATLRRRRRRPCWGKRGSGKE